VRRGLDEEGARQKGRSKATWPKIPTKWVGFWERDS